MQRLCVSEPTLSTAPADEAGPTRERAIRIRRDAGVSDAAENAVHVACSSSSSRIGPARKSNCRVLESPASCTPAWSRKQAGRRQNRAAVQAWRRTMATCGTLRGPVARQADDFRRLVRGNQSKPYHRVLCFIVEYEQKGICSRQAGFAVPLPAPAMIFRGHCSSISG